MAHLCGAYQTIKQLLISIVGTSLIVFVCHVVRVVLQRNGRFSSFELASLWTRIALGGARLPPTNLDNHSWFLVWQSVSCKCWYGILQFFSYTDCRDDSCRKLLKVSVCQSYGQNTVGAVFSRHGVVPVHNKKLSDFFEMLVLKLLVNLLLNLDLVSGTAAVELCTPTVLRLCPLCWVESDFDEIWHEWYDGKDYKDTEQILNICINYAIYVRGAHKAQQAISAERLRRSHFSRSAHCT